MISGFTFFIIFFTSIKAFKSFIGVILLVKFFTSINFTLSLKYFLKSANVSLLIPYATVISNSSSVPFIKSTKKEKIPLPKDSTICNIFFLFTSTQLPLFYNRYYCFC